MKENFVGRWLDSTFGFRGRTNLLSWAVAGGMAYYFFYLPEQRKAEQHRVLYEQKRRLYEEKGLWDVDKSKPIPDKQQYGLLVGAAQQQQPQQQQQQPGEQQQAPSLSEPSAPAAAEGSSQ